MSQTPSQDSLYTGPRQGTRAPYVAKPPSNGSNPASKSNGKSHDPTAESTQDRAARYEDEKRRIVESCFSKKEDDGVAAESYITHVRVIEDGAYPASPPPPESSASNKKSRVILVAVRKSGRVRVHKARENPTGTFSIGKTWPLEELSGIQSYTNLVPRNNQEQMEKQWASGVGFVVTLGKSYYWQAPTSKEKDFFIGSLVKIYRKYTGGKLPELFGFGTHEIELLTGAGATPNLQSNIQTPPLPAQAISSPPPIPASNERRAPSPHSSRSQNGDQTNRFQAQSRNDRTQPARDVLRPSPVEPLRSPARNDNRQQGQNDKNQSYLDSTTSKPYKSDSPSVTSEHLQPQHSRLATNSQSPQQQLPEARANGNVSNGTLPLPHAPYSESQQGETSSNHSTGSRPNTAVSDQRFYESKTDTSTTLNEPPSDRKQPFVSKSEGLHVPRSGPASESNSQFATPATSPSDLAKEKSSEVSVIGRTQPISHVSDNAKKDYFNQDKSIAAEASQTVPPSAPEKSVMARSDTVTTDGESSPITKKADEEHRPGLGPMIKKKSAKDIAGQFRKAALAAGAFQPRQGGAGARLKALQDKDKASNEPDGITSVVPAPLLRGITSDSLKSSAPATPTVATHQEQTITKLADDVAPNVQIQRSATEDSITAPDIRLEVPTEPVSEASKVGARSPSPQKPRSRSPQRKKRQRQESEIARYCSALNIDPRSLEGRGADFNDLLTEFGWDGKLVESRRVEDFEVEIKREIGRAQATGWLGHVEQQEGKVQDLSKAFDKAIEECEELDGLFTLYSHELDTLAADIEYIEAQSQGLQVQTANQKLLQNELNGLLKTLTIPSGDLRGLQSGSLSTDVGIETVERALVLLYKALITIDPDIRQNKIRQTVSSNPDRGGVGVYADTEIGQMWAVREKKDHYREASMSFVNRFNQHITAMLKGIDESSLYENRQNLWKYNAMMLFTREVNSYEWQTLITSYEINLKGIYQNQFRDYAMGQRRTVRKQGNEDLEALFTSQEKEKPDETLASSAARKLTVRRGKTVKAGALRQQLGEKRDGRSDACDVFRTVLKQQCDTISEEQNWISSLFHLNSQVNADFAEIVGFKLDQRRFPNLRTKQPYDPDRNMARIVQGVIEGIYSFWLADLQNLLDWALGMHVLQGVGVLAALEQSLGVFEETNQEYIVRTLRVLHERLTGLFNKFVDEQIRAIEETKVKVKKRKGIISFVRTFPLFSAIIEQMMPSDTPSDDTLEVRFILNDAYSKILKAMWESLNFIAKDDPATGGVHQSTAPSSGDPEDKEALNYHILLIENMNYYLEEVDTQKNIVLDEWADKARQDFLAHLTQYTDSVIRRPLGKWLDFLESTEAMIKNSDTGGISNKPSHSRSAAKKVLSTHDGKEIKKGIETLKKRIEKHFGDIEDPSTTAKTLILRVFEECNARYSSAHDRMQLIINTVYDGNLEIDWRKDEVASMFKK